MITERMKFLLLEAAKCFDDGYSPFQNEWLSKHNVTADECMTLSSTIGIFLRGSALVSEEIQKELIVKAVI